MKFNQTSESMPEDCKEVIATRVLRFKHYKENSQQSKRGLKGRWQEHDGYDWKNCEEPCAWIYLDEFNKGEE